MKTILILWLSSSIYSFNRFKMKTGNTTTIEEDVMALVASLIVGPQVVIDKITK